VDLNGARQKVPTEYHKATSDHEMNRVYPLLLVPVEIKITLDAGAAQAPQIDRQIDIPIDSQDPVRWISV